MQPAISALVKNRTTIQTKCEMVECNHPRFSGLARSQDQDQGAVPLDGPARRTRNQTPA